MEGPSSRTVSPPCSFWLLKSAIDDGGQLRKGLPNASVLFPCFATRLLQGWSFTGSLRSSFGGMTRVALRTPLLQVACGVALWEGFGRRLRRPDQLADIAGPKIRS